MFLDLILLPQDIGKLAFLISFSFEVMIDNPALVSGLLNHAYFLGNCRGYRVLFKLTIAPEPGCYLLGPEDPFSLLLPE